MGRIWPNIFFIVVLVDWIYMDNRANYVHWLVKWGDSSYNSTLSHPFSALEK